MSDADRREEMLAAADAVLRAVPAGTDAEVTATASDSALTRYANGAIHQNVADSTVRLRLRLVRDGRSGVAEMQVGSGDAGAALIRTAEAIRAHAPHGDPVPLYIPDGGEDSDRGFAPATAACTPEQRADHVATVCAAASARGQLAYGGCETVVDTVAMVSTAGLRRCARHSVAELVAVCRGDDGSAYAARHHRDVARLDVAELAAEVTERCQRNQGAAALEPGTYEVVLSPYAVAEMLEYLGMVGLGGLAVLEERSFMRMGERLMSTSVTITDDASVEELAPMPFDGEGATTRPVTLVDEGVCRAVVHDSVTAARCGVPSTGHSFEQPNTQGPLPRYLALRPGSATPDGLIAACERGLLVTRFWYVRPVHPLATVITGMSRDGTFRIDGGRVTAPVRDLRFTQSIVAALSDVRAISSERLAVRGYFGAMLAPWLHLGAFTFSS